MGIMFTTVRFLFLLVDLIHDAAHYFFVIPIPTDEHAVFQFFQGVQERRNILFPDMAEDCGVGVIF